MFQKRVVILVTLVLSLVFAASIAMGEAETFVGSASGYGGSIRVTISVVDGALTELTATGKGETEGIGTTAVEKMAVAMLENKTWDVDLISGATITGEAMKTAAQQAMEQAGLLNASAEPETFVGSASGYGGSIRVTITAQNGKLLELTATGKGETEGIGTTAVEKMAADMLANKTWDVDLISGATITGEAMKKAAQMAMEQAGPLDFSEDGLETVSDGNSTEPETFVGSASGYGGSIRVTVSIVDGELVDLTATGKGETEGIGTTAVEKMAADMLESKTWDVDLISGATITGEAMKKAAQMAMEQAGL